MKHFKEELLHFIWRSKLLVPKSLTLISGEPLTVLQPGIYNENAGPDFLNAKIKIGETVWYGNIEFHKSSSDWYAHKHHLDDSYNNVILHVVYHHDKEVRYANGKAIPTLELYTILPPLLLNRYHFLQQSKSTIPCEPVFALPEKIHLQAWLERLFVSRLERKTTDFQWLLNEHKNNWEEAFYIYTAKYFGAKTNAIPFEWLAKRIPLSLIAKLRHQPLQLQALCLGMAGFLTTSETDKQKLLSKEFQFLKHKHKLKEMDKSVWKFSRLRPGAFPTVRIEQFAQLLSGKSHLFSEIVQCKTTDELRALYRMEGPSGPLLTPQVIDHLLINSVLPVLFLYNKQMQTGERNLLVPDYYESLRPEKNKITEFWTQMGLHAENALISQALIELKTEYCDQIKCLHCGIGQTILLNEAAT